MSLDRPLPTARNRRTLQVRLRIRPSTSLHPHGPIEHARALFATTHLFAEVRNESESEHPDGRRPRPLERGHSANISPMFGEMRRLPSRKNGSAGAVRGGGGGWLG